MTEPANNPAAPGRTWLVAGGLALIVVVIAVITVRQQLRRSAGPPLPVLYGVSDFQLTNQLGQTVTVADLRDRVSVVNVIFTRCPGPCLTMSRQFAKLQKQLPDDASVRLVTMTIDPEFDTPEVLGRYGAKLGTDPKRWWFLSGALKELRRVAIDDFKFVAVEKGADQQESKDDLFIHSTYFMIVDQRGRVRAVIESTEPGALEQTMAAVNQLLNES
jgi:protein SCO1